MFVKIAMTRMFAPRLGLMIIALIKSIPINPMSPYRPILLFVLLTATTPTEALARQAEGLDELLVAALPREHFFIGSDESYAGGGSLPDQGLPTVVIRWKPSFAAVDDVAARLRLADPPVIARIHEDTLCFDLRTIPQGDFEALVGSVASTVPESFCGE